MPRGPMSHKVGSQFHTGSLRSRRTAPICSLAPSSREARTLPALSTASTFGTKNTRIDRRRILIECLTLRWSRRLRICRPGHRRRRDLAPRACPPTFRAVAGHQRHAFPRGIDVLLVADDEILCIPRTTKLVKRETEACMSPSKAAKRPSRMPIGCWPTERRGDRAVPGSRSRQICRTARPRPSTKS